MLEIKNFFKNIDIYGTDVQLYIQGENKYRTFIGGLATIITVSFTVFFIIYFGMELILRNEPNVNNYYIDDRLGSVINNTNFLIAVRIKNFNGSTIDVSHGKYFSWAISLQTSDTSKTRFEQLRNDPIKQRICLDSDVQGFYERNGTDTYTFKDVKQSIVDDFVCPDLAEGVLLKGNSFQSIYAQNLVYTLECNVVSLMKDFNMTYDQLFFAIRLILLESFQFKLRFSIRHILTIRKIKNFHLKRN